MNTMNNGNQTNPSSMRFSPHFQIFKIHETIQMTHFKMWRFFIIVLSSVIWSCASSESVLPDLPCHFLDSINITSGTLQPNNSILFNGNQFSHDHYALVDYILKSGEKRVPVAPHYRGCLCDFKPCIRFCCPFGSIAVNKNKTKKCQPHEAARHLESEIFDHNNEAKLVRFDEHFGIVDDRPCKISYSADEPFQISHVSIKLWRKSVRIQVLTKIDFIQLIRKVMFCSMTNQQLITGNTASKPD